MVPSIEVKLAFVAVDDKNEPLEGSKVHFNFYLISPLFIHSLITFINFLSFLINCLIHILNISIFQILCKKEGKLFAQ